MALHHNCVPDSLTFNLTLRGAVAFQGGDHIHQQYRAVGERPINDSRQLGIESYMAFMMSKQAEVRQNGTKDLFRPQFG
jgi:hypothetical protein